MDIQFGRLSDLPLREAWKHEALDFTPWLADNIEHLSDAIGIPLELTGTEVAVDNFSADILARNPMDDTIVLIENQLETTDHTHLGQIMTYLAGLDAQTVIWIAPEFRAAHLSAIRWLNEHTADGFSFFAVKARVVRIGDSPFAPIFEVTEKPDGWSRSLVEKKRAAAGNRDPLSDTRLGFWTHYLNKYPKAVADGMKPTRGWNSYSTLAQGDVNVSVWIGEKNAGIYVTGGRGDFKQSARDLLSQNAIALSASLGVAWGENNSAGHALVDKCAKSYTDPSQWDSICNWLEERRVTYITNIQAVLEATT